MSGKNWVIVTEILTSDAFPSSWPLCFCYFVVGSSNGKSCSLSLVKVLEHLGFKHLQNVVLGKHIYVDGDAPEASLFLCVNTINFVNQGEALHLEDNKSVLPTECNT